MDKNLKKKLNNLVDKIFGISDDTCPQNYKGKYWVMLH